MLRCEAEVMDVIDDMLMADEELMAELEAQLYDEVETYTEDMFESEADWDDFNICCIEDDYIFNHKSIIDILTDNGYLFEIWKHSTTNEIQLTINANKNNNIHWLSKAFCKIAYENLYSQRTKQEYFRFRDCSVIIQYQRSQDRNFLLP